MKTKDHIVVRFAFLLNNISWLCFHVSKYKATSFYKKWLHGMPSCGKSRGSLNHPLPVEIWVVSNRFDTIHGAVYYFVHISFALCTFSVEEIPRSGIAR